MAGKRIRFRYSKLGNLNINDTVITPGKNELLKAKVFGIQEQGISDIYTINLSDGTSFKTHIKHYTTVCFRQKNGEPVWDSLTTEWMMANPQYHYTILNDYNNIHFKNFLQLCLMHDAEPDDNIEPYIMDGTYIVSIEKEEYKENCRCLSLNDPVGLYFTNNGILTHNSALSAIIQLYISTHFAMMWHPYKYFGQSSATVYIQALGAWSQKKGSEILLEPILNIINSSPYFKQVRGSKDITDEEAPPDEVANQLLWTTASKTSALTMQGGVNYKTVAGDKDIIGSSQPLDSDIYLPDGTIKKMGDLKVGDVIASPTEGSQTVLHIFPKPKIRCWKITLSDGRTVRCAADHMWKIAWQKKPNGKWDWQVKPFQFILDHSELKFEIWDKDNCDDIPYIWDENTK
jgi:hypothetical protein